jgi:adenosylcobinamide-GDP ribazoletransferase
MKKLWNRINLTLGFFTTLPVKYVEWTEEDNKYMPLFIPFVGIVIAVLFYLLLLLLNILDLSYILSSIIVVVFFIFITGGLHLDAFMDTCDAHFSRRDISRKLEIMTDSNIGAFAAVFFVVLMLVKFGVLHDLFLNDIPIYSLIIIPVISRLFQSLLLLNSPFAKEDGLARMYGSLHKKYQWYFLLYFALIIIVGVLLQQIILYSILVFVCALYMFVYKRFAIKQFGGITGDVIGAYIEISEVLLLITILIYTLL